MSLRYGHLRNCRAFAEDGPLSLLAVSTRHRHRARNELHRKPRATKLALGAGEHQPVRSSWRKEFRKMVLQSLRLSSAAPESQWQARNPGRFAQLGTDGITRRSYLLGF